MALIRRREPQTPSVARRGWDPFEAMHELMSWDPFREISSAFGHSEPRFMPAFDLKETKNAYVIKADLPGLREEDLDLSVLGNQLTISGRRTHEKHEEGDRMYMYERSYGSFTRTFTLPEGADPDRIEADLNHGVLTVTISKKAGMERRKIPLFWKKKTENKA